MEKPKAPEGWKVTDFDYRGESPKDYDVSDDHLVLMLEQTCVDPARVWVSVRTDPDEGVSANYFNVYRSGEHELPHLDPAVETASKGIEYALMVAEKYINAPTEEIPGAREAFFRSQEKLEATANKLGIPVRKI